MRKFYLFIFIICQFLIIKDVFSQECEKPEAIEDVRIYFVNGMNNRHTEIVDGREALRELLENNPKYDVGYSKNTREPALIQALEVFRQRTSEEVEPRFFWDWFENPSIPSANREFVKALADLYIEDGASAEFSADKEQQKMVNQYLRDLRSGKMVVLVAHSQGNFYANNAYEYIVAQYPQYKKNIGVVAVGSPSSKVAGSGFHTNNSLDRIINTVVRVIGGYPVLENNYTYDNTDESSFDRIINHSFTDTYLANDGAGREVIKRHILATIEVRLEKPFIHSNCDPYLVEVETLSAKDITDNSARMRARLSKGRQADVWFLAKKGGNSGLNCFPSDKDGVGQYTSFSEISQPLDNLEPNTVYYYRVCAKGKTGRRSQGRTRQIKTKKAPPPPPPPSIPCGSHVFNTGGTNGLRRTVDFGTESGELYVEFQPFKIRDAVELYDPVNRIRYNSGFVTQGSNGEPSVARIFKPSNSRYWDIRVYGNSDANTAWELFVSCPGQVPRVNTLSSSKAINSVDEVFSQIPEYVKKSDYKTSITNKE